MSEEAGRINEYHCQTCGGFIVTRNKHIGTTPFMLSCHATAGCPGDMYSQFYRVDQLQKPTHEWYRPFTTGEKKKITSPSLQTHADKGGLLLRSLAS